MHDEGRGAFLRAQNRRLLLPVVFLVRLDSVFDSRLSPKNRLDPNPDNVQLAQGSSLKHLQTGHFAKKPWHYQLTSVIE